MAVGDRAGYETVQLLNRTTLPELERIAKELLERIHGLVVALANGAVITVTIALPERRPITPEERCHSKSVGSSRPSSPPLTL
jgi:hypothetical protein